MRRLALLALSALLVAACNGAAAPTTTVPGATTTTGAGGSTTTTTPTGPFTWFRGIDTGVCFDDALSGGSFNFDVPAKIVSCSGEHDNEVIAMYDLGDNGYPTGDIASTVLAGCSAEYALFLGRPVGQSLMSNWEVYPSESDWAAGAHAAACILYAGEPTKGSARSGSLTAPGEVIAAVYEVADSRVVGTFDAGTGEMLHQLSPDALLAQDSPPGWTFDGTVIGYAAGPSNTDRSLYVVDAAGGADPVAVEGIDLDQPGTVAFNPVQTEVMAFIASVGGGEFDIYLYDGSTGDISQVTTSPDRDTSPSWSPDGSLLAYRGRVDGNSDIYVVDAAGETTRLTTDEGFDGDPRWSPDGTKILFTSDRSGDYEIWVMNADGSDQRNLTNHPADDEYPTWSSDGSYIAFQSTRQGGISLWLMRADGSDQSLLSSQAPLGYPSFSPVGG
jgi:hypothetical protein